MKKKTYFAALNKETNELFVATTKSSIARSLDVQYITIYRQLSKFNPYINDKYIIWEDITIDKIANREDNTKKHVNSYRR